MHCELFSMQLKSLQRTTPQVLIDKRNIAESLLFERLGILEFLETQYIFFFSFIRFRDIGIAISFLMEF